MKLSGEIGGKHSSSEFKTDRCIREENQTTVDQGASLDQDSLLKAIESHPTLHFSDDLTT